MKVAASWLRRNLFGTPASALLSLAVAGLVAWAAAHFLQWALVDAVFALPAGGDTSACRAEGAGACWAVVGEKHRLILFGLYPHAEQWRPALATALLLGMFAASMPQRAWRPWLGAAWALAIVLFCALMGGGVAGLAHVPETQWGGLPVTLLLTACGMLMAFPAAVLVALGRMSTRAWLRTACWLYVEIVRGVPLVSVLFMASILFPLFLPQGVEWPKLLRAQLALAIFVAGYLSEIVRGGLLTIGRGQVEAADALGMSYWQSVWLIRLPQALVAALPPIVSLVIGLLKSTSLVMTIGIFDLLNAAKRAVAEPALQSFGTEMYLFAASIYFSMCLALSRYGQALERQARRGR